MENMTLKLIDEHFENNTEAWSITNDKDAEFAIKKIAEEKKELQRTELLIDSIISEYQFKKRIAQEQFEKKTQYLKDKLLSYFESVDKKTSKTQSTYKLPSGTLKKKYGGQVFDRNEEKLLEWIKQSGRNKLVKTKEYPDWEQLKKEVTVTNGKAVTTDGEVVDGVVVTDKPDTFDIEF